MNKLKDSSKSLLMNTIGGLELFSVVSNISSDLHLKVTCNKHDNEP